MTKWPRDSEIIKLDDHSSRHEDGGADEISIAGLLGLLAQFVGVSELSGATYDDVQDYMNFFGDRTILSGGTITDNGDGTAAIASVTGWCKETDSDTAVGKFFDYGGGNTPALTDMARNYVYIDYNGGTVQIVASTSLLTHAQKFDHILIGTIFRNGTILHWHQHHNIGIERANTVDLYELEEHAAARVDGMATSDAGSRAISITSGVLYEGIDREPTSPFDTPNSGTADATEANKLHDADGGFASTDVGKSVHNTTDDTYAIVTAFVNSGELTLDADIFISGENYDLDIFSYWYTADSGSTWTEVKGSTLISNTQYNNITAGLASLTANRYGVHWVYMDLDGSNLHVVYGQGDYKANEAEEASAPSVLPPNVSEYGVLIAKIILQEGQTAMIISLPWTTVFVTTLATDHGSLGGLSDDDHIQYIKDSEFTAADEIIVGTGSGTFGQVALGASQFLAKKSSGVATNVTAAQAMAILSGAAGATFSFNSQNLINIGTSTHYGNLDFEANGLRIAADNTNDYYLMFQARDTGNARVEVGRLQGAADPYFSTGGGQEFKFYNSGIADFGAYTLNGTMTLNGQVFNAGSGNAQVTTSGSAKGMEVTSTTGSADGVAFDLYTNSGTPLANDRVAFFRFYGKNSVGGKIQYGRWFCRTVNVTENFEEGKYEFVLAYPPTENVVMTITGIGELWVDTFINPDDGVKVAGTQVVSAQGAAVADPTDAASTQARLTDLLGRLRTHGLIAT